MIDSTGKSIIEPGGSFASLARRMVAPSPKPISTSLRVRRELRRVHALRALVTRERNAIKTMKMPWRRRLSMWRRGFLGESDVIYGLSSKDSRLYLSDFRRSLVATLINFGPSNPVLTDKLMFYYAMKTVGGPTPRFYGLVDQVLTWVDPPPGFAPSEGVMGLLKPGHELVVKPVDGSGGRGVALISVDQGAVLVNGVERDAAHVAGLLVPGMMIQERVHQAGYAARISPSTSNTIRVITMWDHARGEPFVGAAVHRFGTARSAPVDSWSQGGLSVAIDVETGELGRGAAFPYSGELSWHAEHPDTGAPIEGTVVPGWDAIKQELLRLAGRLPRLYYIGWDVLAADEGFNLIEGNTLPDINLLQVHGPLLANARVAAFYRHHGVVAG